MSSKLPRACRKSLGWFSVLICLLAASYAQLRAADEPLSLLEEQAMKAAVARVAPAVVRIETVGGLERIGKLLLGTGPTTGLVVSADGYVVSSAFNFVNKPDSILVNLPSGARVPARLVATDHSRQLVLLKVTAEMPLTPAEASPRSEMRVGQWAIAVGRTYDGGGTNVSVGIVSALDRIWSKALQTDAKISPSNYGGPLVDIRGRVLGILVPLQPDASGDVAGVEWYDSGIGFAVPLEHVLATLPRWQKGQDLHPGILGINLTPGDQFSLPPTLAACRTGSPAYQAGLRAGDKIIELNGRKVVRQSELKHQLNPHYAGDTVKVAWLRGTERTERDITLAEKLPAYEFPFLGILPKRPVAADEKRLEVRYVYPDSPAAKAGLKEGDVIVKAADADVTDATSFAEKLRAIAPGDKLALQVKRGEENLDLSAQLTHLPEDLPQSLPVAHGDPKEREGDKPATGVINISVPEFKNDCPGFVPENYNANLAYGVVVYLHAPGGFKQDELIDQWRSHCTDHDLILLAPKSADPTEWQPTEAAFVRRALADLSKNYHLDKSRIVILGHQGGGALGYLVTFGNRDIVRGLAVVDASMPVLASPPETDPLRPLAFYVATSAGSPKAAEIEQGIARVRSLKHPVSVKDVGPQPRYLTADELEELVNWIDSLDRL